MTVTLRIGAYRSWLSRQRNCSRFSGRACADPLDPWLAASYDEAGACYDTRFYQHDQFLQLYCPLDGNRIIQPCDRESESWHLISGLAQSRCERLSEIVTNPPGVAGGSVAPRETARTFSLWIQADGSATSWLGEQARGFGDSAGVDRLRSSIERGDQELQAHKVEAANG